MPAIMGGMGFTMNQTMYAMYVIGQVESNHTWTAVNYHDPITLGMMQWYGTRAHGLLNRGRTEDPDGWAAFKAAAPSLAAHVEANDLDWPHYYITAAEGNAFIAWAGRDEQHAVQQNQFTEDCAGYGQVCDQYGFPAGNIAERIYFMVMWHQGPKYALQVIGGCSATAGLQLLHTTCLNNGVLGQYANRYTTAYDMLRDWDERSAPPDFGQVSDTQVVRPGEGGNKPPAQQATPAAKSWIQAQGDCLYLHEGDKVRQYRKTVSQTWLYAGEAGKPIEGGQKPAEPVDPTPEPGDSKGDKVLKLYESWEGRFAYSQAGGRLDPLNTGYGDCSSTIWRAYQDALGIDVGTWTGAMVGKGTQVYHSDRDSVAEAIAGSHAGDLLLLAWSWRNPSYDHVEMMTGGPRCIGHGGPGMGPTYKDAATQMQGAVMWEIRRHV